MIYAACIVFAAALLLLFIEGKLLGSARLRRRLDEHNRRRIDSMAGGLLLAVMGAAFLVINIGALLEGKYEGVRLGTVTRAGHPFWFWTLAVIFFPSAIGVIWWGISEFVEGWRGILAADLRR